MKNYKRQTAILLSVFVLFCFLLQAPKPAKAEDLNLTGLNLKAYNLVKAEVLKIISGERKDTKIIITPEQLGLTKKYYAADAMNVPLSSLYRKSWTAKPSLRDCA